MRGRGVVFTLVPGTGLEPVWHFCRGILSPGADSAESPDRVSHRGRTSSAGSVKSAFSVLASWILHTFAPAMNDALEGRWSLDGNKTR